MLLQTNSYIVPKEKKTEHARLLRRFRQTLAKLGCEHFEVYEQVSSNWSTDGGGRFVQIMRFRDRRHQQQIQAAERTDATAQALIEEFCQLINFPYQQQQGLFAVGFYTSALPAGSLRDSPESGEREIEGAQDAVADAPGAGPSMVSAAAPQRPVASPMSMSAGGVVARAAGASMVSQLLAAEVAPPAPPARPEARPQPQPEPLAPVSDAPAPPGDWAEEAGDAEIDLESFGLDEAEGAPGELEPLVAELETPGGELEPLASDSLESLDLDDLAVESSPVGPPPGTPIDLDEASEGSEEVAAAELSEDPAQAEDGSFADFSELTAETSDEPEAAEGTEAESLEAWSAPAEPDEAPTAEAPTLESIFAEEELVAEATASGKPASASVFTSGSVPAEAPETESRKAESPEAGASDAAVAPSASETPAGEEGLDFDLDSVLSGLADPLDSGPPVAEVVSEVVSEAVSQDDAATPDTHLGSELSAAPTPGPISEADSEIDELSGLLDIKDIASDAEPSSEETAAGELHGHGSLNDDGSLGDLDDDAALAMLSEPAAPMDADALQLDADDVLPDGAEPLSPRESAAEKAPTAAHPAAGEHAGDASESSGAAMMDEDSAMDALSESAPLDPGFGSVLNAISDDAELSGEEPDWDKAFEKTSDKPARK